MLLTVSKRLEFSASRRLHIDHWSDGENLVVFGPETSVGIVRLFFDQMVQQLSAVAPREQAPAPMLAENFETELNASLKALFGR